MLGTWTLTNTTAFSYVIPGGLKSETGYTNFASDTNTMELNADGQCQFKGNGLGQGFDAFVLTGRQLSFSPIDSAGFSTFQVDNISAHTMQIEHSDSPLTTQSVWRGYTTVWTYSR